ncbi:MAG TPA: hypothetical protein VI874_00465, partial [Candidatus Norongarragalinales archaeon]|nr:hypothetical protein [Candidatus Norongarragalinales archaeon]
LEKNAFFVGTDFFVATAWTGQINHLAKEGKTRILKYLNYYITKIFIPFFVWDKNAFLWIRRA